MKHLTVIHYRYKNERILLTKRFGHGSDAIKWLDNKLGFGFLDFHTINKEVTS